MGMHIAVGGRPTLVVDGVALDDRGLGTLGRRALVLLVLERHRTVAREELAEVLWDGAPPATWAAATRGAVSRIRRSFAAAGLDPSDVLVAEGGGYRLHLPAGLTVDVEEAGAAVTAAASALAAGDPTRARDTAATAVQVLADRLLPEASGEWVEGQRRALDEVELHGLELLGRAELATGDAQGAIARAGRVLAMDPYRESAHRLLIEAHAAADNPASALRAYDECRRLLASELGVGPSAATEALYQSVLAPHEVPASATSPPVAGRVALPGALRRPQDGVVGRTRELAALLAAWGSAADGEVRGVLLTGEAGVGKTRLAAELAAAIEPSEPNVCYGRCHQDGVVPFQPFVEVIRQYALDRSTEQLVAEAGAGLGHLCRLVPELRDRPGIDPAPSDAAARHELFDAVAVLLARAAATTPLLVVLDDLHWADTATLLMLRHLLARPDAVPLLVLACYRDIDLEPHDDRHRLLGEIGTDAGVERVALTGLDPDAVATLLAGRMVTRPGESLVQAVHRDTGGNPFFVESLAQHLEDQPAQATTADGLLSSDGRLPVPDGVRHLVSRRLATLDAATRSVLGAAAVSGRTFTAGLLAEVTTLAHDEVLDALDAAIATGLVAEEYSGGSRFGFVHDLVRHGLYDLVPLGDRARLHERVGRALERRSGRRTARAADLSHHFDRAGTDLAKAAAYARRAGAEAIDQLAYEDAATHFEHALDALERCGAPGRQRAEVLIDLGDARDRAAAIDAARTAFLDAVDLAREAGAADLLADAVLGYGALHAGVGQNDPRHVELLHEAITDARAMADDRRLALLLSQLHLAGAMLHTSPEGALLIAEEAEAAARRSGDDEALAAALTCRWSHLWHPADIPARLAVSTENAALAQSAADPGRQLDAAEYRIIDLLSLGRLDDADEEISRHRDRAEQTRLPRPRWMAAVLASTLALTDGRIEDSERLAADARTLGDVAAKPDVAACFQMHRLALRREQGRLGELQDQAARVLDLAPQAPHLRCFAGFVFAESGNPEAAAVALEPVDGLPPDVFWLLSTALVAEAALHLGDTARIEQIYDQLAPHDDQLACHVAIILGAVADLNGALARHLGRFDDAAQHHERALAVTAQRPRSPMHVRALHRCAMTLRARGGRTDAGRARALQAEAHAIAADTGLIRLAELTAPGR